VELTEAGRILAAHAREILVRLDCANADLVALARREAATVRVAGLEELGPRTFARVLRALKERRPLAHLLVDDATSEEAKYQRLSAGSVDVVIGEPPAEADSFICDHLDLDPYVLLVAADSWVVRREGPLTPKDLGALRLIAPVRHGLRASDEERLREQGVALWSTFHAESATTAQALVGAGLVEAIMPASQVDRTNRATVVIEIPHILPARTITVARDRRRECSPSMRAFIRTVGVSVRAEKSAGALRSGARPHQEPDAGWQQPA
jgi:DNA-binding transcriptional LysR family regulator